MSDSLVRTSLRAFLIAFFAFLGILLSFAVIIGLFSSMSDSEESVPNTYSVEIRPNADGVRKKLAGTAPVILELEINGTIGSIELNQEKIQNLLVESRENTLEDDRVKGLLVRITSPGGTIHDADGIYRAIKAYKARYKVPVYAYADGLCASGGMYVACAADKIYASDVTLIGSIGVITSSFMNVHKLLDKLGVYGLTVSEGKGKDELNPIREWKPDEDKTIKDIIKYYYSSFVDLVTENRPRVSKEALINEYGARVFPARTAQEIGLIDEAGATRDSTLKNLVHALSIEDDFYQVVALTSTNWLSQLINVDSPALTGKIKHEITYEGQLPKELLNKPLYLYKP